jgi:acetate kinase
MRPPIVVLCLNCGSSSLKFALFRVGRDEEARIAAGAILGVGQREARLQLRRRDGSTLTDEAAPIADTNQAVERAFSMIAKAGLQTPQAVGHRLVHGGDRFALPVLIDDAVLASLREIAPLAPLHMPVELGAIEASRARYPELPEVACFDTAFHRDLPARSRRLPLPASLDEKGVRRYGFHGLSFQYVVEKLGPALGERAIVAHLGSGASLAALRLGRPIATTMSFTPAGGLMMGTRPGDLDPGIVFHLLRSSSTAEDVAELERVLLNESGLYGVSGSSSDMKKLLAARAEDERAALAVEMFVDRVKMGVGAYAAALGGIDTLVFTGGIGEHAAIVRSEICSGLEFLGIRLDRAANEAPREVISPAGGPTVRVVSTDEERVIARSVGRLLAAQSFSHRPIDQR